MSFQDEMDKRLRRLAGITDDEVRVVIREDVNVSSSGGCDTCDYGREAEYSVEVTFYKGNQYLKYLSFYDLGALIRDLDSVNLHDGENA